MKTVNYTPEATRVIVEAYQDTPTKTMIAALADRFGKTVRSIIAKLSREGVYIKPVYVSKNGAMPETKSAKVEKIAALLGVPADKLSGLDAATKITLDLIVNALAEKTEAEPND